MTDFSRYGFSGIAESRTTTCRYSVYTGWVEPQLARISPWTRIPVVEANAGGETQHNRPFLNTQSPLVGFRCPLFRRCHGSRRSTQPTNHQAFRPRSLVACGPGL